MTLTALIIGFAVTALLLAMAYRVYTTHRSVDLDDLSPQPSAAPRRSSNAAAACRARATTPRRRR